MLERKLGQTRKALGVEVDLFEQHRLGLDARQAHDAHAAPAVQWMLRVVDGLQTRAFELALQLDALRFERDERTREREQIDLRRNAADVRATAATSREDAALNQRIGRLANRRPPELERFSELMLG